ncbi:MAG: sensor histidine kinase [Roseofilum sp. Guam]|nr:sensor histidine kinase [Roseofilum sp. Guam]
MKHLLPCSWEKNNIMSQTLDTLDMGEKIARLEKENRILRKKLERSEKNCLELEETNEKKESLLRQVIVELKNSQEEVAQKRQLEETLSKLKRTQAQLIQAEKMSSLGHLVAGVAHEINNPVSFIYGNLSHIEEYFQDLLGMIHLYQEYDSDPQDVIQDYINHHDLEFVEEDLPKILKSIKIGTERICEIVLSLRTFSRMDQADVKEVDIHEGIDSTLMILQHRLKEQPDRPEIQVTRNYGKLPVIECYPGQLNQVFMNILANAIDALEERPNPQSSQIIVSTTTVNSDWIQITISDNGRGIPETVQPHIFNPFFTTKAIGQGTGMGLAISHQIITETHMGQILCHSTPGKGTEFIIQIPISPQLKPTNT